ncbi:uncharacterized protein [Pagrus major]|uniref:uncharacterized protein isoform X2 n=1 Tax=Pagrus major TaxID=143350 RepID=UPI003CC8D9FB
MAVLLKSIRNYNKEAARVIERAGLHTDSAIKSLTREDLRDLIPGPEKFQVRRDIYELIHKQKPVEVLLRELKEFIPHEPLRAALNNNGVLVDYLHMLKDMKGQMDNVQGFLHAHIDLLEELKNAKPQEDPEKGPLSDTSPMMLDESQTGGQSQGAQGNGNFGASGPVVFSPSVRNGYNSQEARGAGSGSSYGQSGVAPQPTQGAGNRSGFSYGQSDVPPQPTQGAGNRSGSSYGQTSVQQQRPQGAGNRSGFSYGQSDVPPQPTQVMYKSVVSGKTFGADAQLMKKVEDQCQDSVQFVARSEDHKITVLFCPISSRIGADVDAAMSDVEGDDKQVILVLMHHTREPKSTTNIRTWSDYKKVVLHVHVYYHETKNGLLSCQQNTDAVSAIRSKLLEYSIPRFQDTSGNALGMGVESGRTTNRGGNSSSSSGGSSWFKSPWSR